MGNAGDSLDAEKPADEKQIHQVWENLYERIVAALDAGERKEVLSLSRKLHEHACQVHDFMMTYSSGLLSHVYRCYGQVVLEDVLAKVMDPDAMQLDSDMPFREKVVSIVNYMRAHLKPFKLVEDDEKVTFFADPCSSGGRLVLNGFYHNDSNGELVNDRQPITYGREELPVYCCHESAMEIAMIKRDGVPLFIVDPAKDIGRVPCHVHIYKRPRDIPEHFYRRLGLKKPEDIIAISREA